MNESEQQTPSPGEGWYAKHNRELVEEAERLIAVEMSSMESASRESYITSFGGKIST